MSCTNLVQLSFAKRLFIGLCATFTLGAGIAACGNGSNDCEEGEQLFNYRGDEAKCYKTCEVSSDCPNDQKCVQGKLCDPQTGDNGDTSGGDTSQDDTFMADTSDSGTGDADSGPVCTPENSGDNTCSEVVDCVSKCPDERSCINNCITDGTCTAQDRFNSFQDCLSTKCGENSSATCRFNQCDQYYRQCNLYGSAKCNETRTCQTKCVRKIRASNVSSTERFRELVTECIVDECPDGTRDAQIQSAELAACTDANCGENAQPGCRFNQCKSQYQNCGDGLFGSETCTGIDRCIANCGTQQMSDYQCEAECVNSGTAQARTERAKVRDCRSTCIDQNIPSDGSEPTRSEINAYFDCFYKSSCNTQLKNCGSGKLGTTHQSCSAVTDCLANCPSDDAQCATNCRWDATGSARAEWTKGIACLQAALGSANQPGPCLQDCVSNQSLDLSSSSCQTCLGNQNCTRYKSSQCNLVKLYQN